MLLEPDVLVIGGGVVGLFCAYYLRRAGATVAVVERGTVGGPQSCSSGNNGFVGTHGAAPLAEPGVLAQGMRWLLNPESPLYIKPRWDADLVRWLWHFRRACNDRDAAASFRVLVQLKKQSLDILRELCAADRLAPTFTARAMLLVFKTPEGLQKAIRSVPQVVEAGVPLRVLGAGELRALEPDVEFDVCGALVNEEGAYLHVPQFITEFARFLQGIGVAIHAHTEVVGLEVAGRRVEQVLTTGGTFRPAATVIAAGVWSTKWARSLGIRLAVQPAKGYSITVRAPSNAPRHPVLLSEGKVALTPLGERLRLGGTLDLSGMDSPLSRRRVDGIRQTVQAYLPRMEATPTLETWTGLRPLTPDSLPFMGRAEPYDNLLISCGHGHIGMGLAPAGGKLIAQLFAGTKPDIDPAPFRVDRLGRPRRWRRPSGAQPSSAREAAAG